ncbi:hypothetical protein AVEN_204500-1, partial [Araneus ventricosus]
QKLRSFYN